jgi:hypothetical protein
MAEVTALYNKFPADSQLFRLLTILPSADKNSTIECTLVEHNIDATEYKYDALSYCWSKAIATVPVIVNGHTEPVTVNLNDALR